MAYDGPREVVASAARTATGTSAAVDTRSAAARLNILVDVTAASGTTPTLDVTVEWSFDGGTTWAVSDPADSFTQLTAAAVRAKQFNIKAPTYRLRWTIAGATPSFTFSVSEYTT